MDQGWVAARTVPMVVGSGTLLAGPLSPAGRPRWRPAA